jgi:hypothetical protein
VLRETVPPGASIGGALSRLITTAVEHARSSASAAERGRPTREVRLLANDCYWISREARHIR